MYNTDNIQHDRVLLLCRFQLVGDLHVSTVSKEMSKSEIMRIIWYMLRKHCLLARYDIPL